MKATGILLVILTLVFTAFFAVGCNKDNSVTETENSKVVAIVAGEKDSKGRI